jgi:hypothetical protein
MVTLEEEKAFQERIDRAIVAAYQARGSSADAEMVERVFQCLEGESVPNGAGLKKRETDPDTVVEYKDQTARLCEWAIREHVKHRISDLQLRGTIRA